ncbi:MAG: hypothetical protein ACTJLK_04060 [Anaplasma sp.]
MFVLLVSRKTNVLSQANSGDKRILPADSPVQEGQQVGRLPRHHSLKCVFTFSPGQKANIVASAFRDITALRHERRPG